MQTAMGEKVCKYTALQRAGIAATEKKHLEKDIFSSKAENMDDLELKARLALKLLEKKESFFPFPGSHEKILRNILHDILSVYSKEKCKFDGSYGPQAPVSYYNLFYGGREENNENQ